MVYRDLDKQALKENGYTVLSKITLLNDNSVFTEDDFIVNWNYEDYRYVPNTGFIGQFVERILDGNLQNIPDNKIFENQEINLQLGIVNGIDDQTTWYDYGNFLITKVEKTDTTGNYKFESADYTKKFNKEYEDTITYPCLAMDLANNVCNQAGVYLDTINYAYYYIVSENGLVAGDYSFKINEMYYRFTLSEDLIKNDVLMFIGSENQLILKKVRDYEVTRTLLEYAQSPSADVYTPLDIRTTEYINFANNDFVIENNQYEEKDTLRKVMQDIGKLAYSWVRVGEDNKVHIDFEQVEKENVDNYDKLTTNEYYVSKKSDLYFGPVNKIVLGMSNIEGESLYKTSEDYTEETECAIRIFDNNLTYTDELRAIALNGCERLFGIEYIPLEIETIGHPWLDGDELIKLTNVDDEEVYTYPFNRSITYAGYIDGKIGAEASSKQNNEYEYESEIVKQINKTSITVDKNNKTITALVSDVNDAQSDIAQLYITSDEISATVEHLNNEYENNVVVSREAEGNPIEIDNAGNYPLEDFKIYGGTSQDGEPTPSNPVDIDTVTSKKSTVSYSGSNIDVNYDYDTDLEKVEKGDLELEGNTEQVQTTQNANLFDEDYYNNDSIYTSDTYKYTLSRVQGNRVLYFKARLKEGKEKQTGVYIAISDSPGKPYMSGTNSAYAISNGNATSQSKDFTGITTLYINIYPNTLDCATIFDNYDIWLCTNNSQTYVPFIPNSPSPDYPQEIQVATGRQEVEIRANNNLESADTLYQRMYDYKSSQVSQEKDGDIDVIKFDPQYYRPYGTNQLFNCYTGWKPNTQYTIRAKVKHYSGGSQFYLQIAYTDGTTTYAQINYNDNNYHEIKILSTANKTIARAGFSYGTTSVWLLDKSSWYVGEGSQTEYPEYKGNIYEINLGKNIFNGANVSTTTPSNWGVSFENDILTIEHKTSYSTGSPNCNLGILPKGTYVLSMSGTFNRLGLYRNGTYDTMLNNNGSTFSVNGTESITLYFPNSNVSTLTYEKMQVEKSNVPTNYSPYFTPIELCKIGDYKDSIFKGKGINLFDGEIKNIAFGTNVDGTHIVVDNTYRGCYIPCEEGKTYSVSRLNNSNSRFRVMFTTTEPVLNTDLFGGTGNVNTYDTALKIENILAPSEAKYLVVYLSNNSQTPPPIMINEGTTALPYEPYNAKDKWVLEKEVGKVVLNGSETGWTKYGAYGGTYLYYISNITNGYTSERAGENVGFGLCNYFGWLYDTNVHDFPYVRFQAGNGKRIYFAYTSDLTLTEWQTWLSTHNTIVNYVLATPTYEIIDNEELINQLNELENCEFNLGLNHYITSSANLPVISNFSINSLTYEIITITDENDSQLSYRPLFRNLELCKIGDYQDYIYLKQGKWYKHSEIGKVVLDGSESGWNSFKDGNQVWNYYKNYPEIKKDLTSLYCVSDYFKYNSTPLNNKIGEFSIGGNNPNKNGNIVINPFNDTTNELATFKTWLSTHNTIVYYVLADSTETEITDEEIVPELNSLMQSAIYQGYNRIYLNDEICEKLYIKYLTNSIFNDTYATRAQLAITNENVSAVVSKSNSLESNLAELQISVDGITTAVESVETLTTDLENSINYLAVDMSANSIIIPTNDEKRPYLSTTYTIPFTATFKGNAVNPTVTTSSPAITGITLTFGTSAINVGVSSSTAIDNLSNSYVINFSYTSEGETYLVSRTLNVALSVKGEDGKDGTSVTILGSYNTLAELQAAHPTGSAGDSYMVGNDLYVWNVSSLAWVDVGQIKGTDGTSSYVYIRYSENQDGNPMVTVPTTSTKYIGVCSTTSSTAPTSYSSYTWSKYSGNDGETTYLHIKYSEDGTTFVPASADVDEGDTPSAWVGILTDTNEVASTNFNDYEWYKFTEDIDDAINKMQSDIKQNSTDITNNYKAIMKDLNDYAKADVVGKLTKRVETIESDDEFVINAISDLQVNGVSQVRTEKGFTFNDNGMTIDANNSITKSVTDTNGIQVLDKSGSSQTELMFAGYDEASQTSIVRTENLAVRTYFNIGSKSRFEDYQNGTGVFI